MNFTNEDRLRLRREANKLQTQLVSTIQLHEAVSMQLNTVAAAYEAKQIERNICELALAAKEPQPINFYKIESVEAATSPTASV